MARMSRREEANAIVMSAFRNNSGLEDLHAECPVFTDARMKELMIAVCGNLELLLDLRDDMEPDEFHLLLDRLCGGEWDRWDKLTSNRQFHRSVEQAASLSIGKFDKVG